LGINQDLGGVSPSNKADGFAVLPLDASVLYQGKFEARKAVKAWH